MRIGIVIWALTLNKGGIERVGSELANAMDLRGHDVVVFCRDPSGVETPRYPLGDKIRVVRFDVGHDTASRARLREALTSASLDVLVAMFSWRDLMWFPVVLEGTGIPLLISEHNHPEIINQERWNKAEREACMSAADGIHSLLEGFKPMFPACFRDRVEAIPNAVPKAQRFARPGAAASRKILLAAGRFDDNHKQFALLIRAFKLLSSAFVDWDLHLYGEGRDGDLYRKLLRELELADRVFLRGVSDDMGSAYASAHLFCIPSRYEGFGLVSVEAHRHGLPVVGFSDCTGTNEIVINGYNGLLAEEMTPRSLADSLSSLMADDRLRDAMGDHARDSASRYDPEPIFDRWEQLIARTAKNGSQRPRMQFEDSDEMHVHRVNLGRLARRSHLFDPSSGQPLFETAAARSLTDGVETATTLRQQRDAAWAKLKHMTDQRDGAWAKIERYREAASMAGEGMALALEVQKSLLNQILSDK